MASSVAHYLTDRVDVTPGSWTGTGWVTISAPALVPSDATGLVLEVQADAANTDRHLFFRSADDTTSAGNSLRWGSAQAVDYASDPANEPVDSYWLVFVPVDANLECEVAKTTGADSFTIRCLGWFGEVSWLSTPTLKSFTANGAWQTVDVTSDLGGDAGGAVAAIVKMLNTSAKTSNAVGVREYGGTRAADMALKEASSAPFLVPLDSSDRLEAQAPSSSGVTAYLLGYVLSTDLVMIANPATNGFFSGLPGGSIGWTTDVSSVVSADARAVFVVHRSQFNMPDGVRFSHPSTTESAGKSYAVGHLTHFAGLNASQLVEHVLNGFGTPKEFEVWGYVEIPDQSLSASPVSATSAPSAGSLAPGAVDLAASTMLALSSALSGGLAPGGVTISAAPVGASSGAVAGDLVPGAIGVAAGVLSASSAPVGATLTPGALALASAVVAAAAAPVGGGIAPGGVTLTASQIAALSSALPGDIGSAVALAAGVVAALSAPASAALSPGEVALLAALSSASSAPVAATVAPGAVTISAGVLSALSLAAPGSLAPGAVEVAAGLLAASSSVMAGSTFAQATLDAGAVLAASAPVGGTVAPGAVDIEAQAISAASAMLAGALTPGQVELAAGILSALSSAKGARASVKIYAAILTALSAPVSGAVAPGEVALTAGSLAARASVLAAGVEVVVVGLARMFLERWISAGASGEVFTASMAAGERWEIVDLAEAVTEAVAAEERWLAAVADGELFE